MKCIIDWCMKQSVVLLWFLYYIEHAFQTKIALHGGSRGSIITIIMKNLKP